MPKIHCSSMILAIAFLCFVQSEASQATEYFFSKGKDVTLRCNLSGNPNLIWGYTDLNKQELVMTLAETKDYSIDHNKLTLKNISNHNMTNAYFCADKPASASDRQMQMFDSNPHISLFVSKQVENVDDYEPIRIFKSAGIRTVIDCTVVDRSGRPDIRNITSYEFFSVDSRNSSLLTPMIKDTTGLSETDAQNEKGMWEFRALSQSDDGEYACRATNAHGTQEVRVEIRCRSALTALWPFLGCALQVLLVSLLLFCVEKRKLKRDVATALAEAKQSQKSQNYEYDHNNNNLKI